MTTEFDPAGEASELLELAEADPAQVIERGAELLARLRPDDHENRAIVLRARAIAARLAATVDDSITYGEGSVSEAELAEDIELRSVALVTLAGSYAIAGDNSTATNLLDSAEVGVTGRTRAIVDFQRGTMLARIGDTHQALTAFDRALEAFEALDDREFVANTQHNLGALHLQAGSLRDAESNLKKALDTFVELNLGVPAAGCRHVLGEVASYRGDVPRAMALFDAGEAALDRLVGWSSEIQVSRVDLLLRAGLIREAMDLAIRIAAEMRYSGLGEDEAEAMLVAAQAALAGGDQSQAQSWASRARDLFDAQDRDTWYSAARLVELQALYAEGDTRVELRQAAAATAKRLGEQRQFIPAATAGMLAGRIALDHGLVDDAERDFARVTGVSVGPVELRLDAFLANALLREARGDPAGADAAARAGMNLLGSYQAAIGASDIRVGIERHATELGEIGLRLALEAKTPRRVFRWMERTRARSLALRPVTPPDDEAQATDLAELRRVTEKLRLAEGGEAADLSREQSALQESIRRRSRTTTGGATVDTGVVGPKAIANALGDRTLVEFAEIGGEIVSIVVKNGRFYLKTLGEAAKVQEELESLRFVMRRLARGRGSVDMAEEVASRLDQELFGQLNLGDGPLVIVPTPALHATPWWALPTCRERSLTVSPSADLWLRATRRDGVSGSTLVVAGPDLELADAEVGNVADLYPKATRFDSDESNVERVHAELDGAGTAHIASHAFFQFENPMFSSLHLGDGDLTVYDIERLARVPDLVVLSACDSGFTDTHAGEELMGLSSALLSMGTKSIIASVGLVPDSHATGDLMVRLHEGLVAGLDPAEAMSEAQVAVADSRAGFVAAASFVCIGAGWNSLHQEASQAL